MNHKPKSERTAGTIRSCSKSQSVFLGGFCVAVVVPWLILVVVIVLYPPLKPVQSQPNLKTATMNTMSAKIVTTIPKVMKGGCFIFCHHERRFAVIVSPLAKPKLCGESLLPCLCFTLSTLLFLANALTEAIGLSDKLKSMCLVCEPVKEGSRQSS